MKAEYRCLNGLVLKIIAAATMLLDHIGAVLYPSEMAFRYIGRIAFPIFVFLLVEGFFYTKNIRKYEIRLLIFALLSEIPFDLAFNKAVLEVHSQNVFFTLFLGLFMLALIKKTKGNFIWEFAVLFIIMAAAYFLNTDYDAGGILLIYVFYRARDRNLIKIIGLAAVSYFVFGPVECFSLPALIPILLYNGQRGFRFAGGLYGSRAAGMPAAVMKYAFYIFYPAHLLILHFIAVQRIAGAV